MKRNEDELVEAPVEIELRPAQARRGLLARFARDRRGVAALEFGMVSIPFLGLLCAIFETAFVYYNHEVFDNAVANVARQILVNQYGSSQTPKAADWVSNSAPSGSNGYSLCGALPTYFTCSKIRVNVSAFTTGTFSSGAAAIDRNFQSASNFAQKDPNLTTIDLGQPGNIVVFQAFYPMPIYLSVLLSSGAQGNQVRNLYGQSSASADLDPTATSNRGMVHYIYSVMVFRNEPQ
jgi:Flp pilus assembly protein TadG